jgi:hypothetical protein
MVVTAGMLWLQLMIEIFRRIFSLEFLTYFLFAVVLVAVMYGRMNKAKRQLYGNDGGAVEGIWGDVIKATALGFLGGIIGSILMVLAGVTLNNIGINYLWLTAILLFLINPRYLCFSYAGGLLSISYLLTGFPRVEVPQLMGLVAILHFVESILILFSGHLGALPVYAGQKHGRVVGGFNLQRFWPIPLVVMWIVPGPSFTQLAQDLIAMPEWWPLLNSPLADNPHVVYTMIPVVAALGYGDLAVTDTPVGKSRWSAERLAIYSLVLLVLAVVASHWGWAAWLAALFGPLGHEFLILKGQQKELRGTPIYSKPERGVMILDVHPGSAAAKMGLASGDIIFYLDGEPVDSKTELAQQLAFRSFYVTVDYLRGGKLRRTQGKIPLGTGLGIIPVPEPGDTSQVQFNVKGPLARLWSRLRSRRKKE